MKLVLRIVAAVIGVVVVLLVLQAIASESGEVVVITTRDAAGAPHETHVWVVDSEGHQWIRSGSPTSGWYMRLQQTPKLELERGGHHAQFGIEPMPAMRAQINALMRSKYGWADAYIGAFFSRANAIPIRLDPLPE
jgi:Uncharacterized protein conserved in bacteria (DUF2255)